MAPHTSENPPRILIVSRRTVRKNKFVDFVGEYHLDLLVGYGAVPIIVPRVAGIDKWLKSFEPIHGVLLCEGEDIDPSLYDADTSDLSLQEQEAVKKIHASDASIDKEKDSIELKLTKLCVERNIPYLGICRGSQILNVVCGGTLYQDVGLELSKKLAQGGDRAETIHMDYQNYDDHRHVVKVVKDTPLHHWFKDSMDEKAMEISVNSYHHQGVKKLAKRFVPMAFAPDGLIEGFYDPNTYNPQEGKFTVGIQFHPERMRLNSTEEFDYPGCSSPYKDFVKAATAYKNKLESLATMEKPIMLVKNNEMEKKRKIILRSFSLTRDHSSIGNEGLSSQQETRLIQMGATVRNSSSYFDTTLIKKVQLHEKELLAFNILRKMSLQQLSDLSTVLLPIYGTN